VKLGRLDVQVDARAARATLTGRIDDTVPLGEILPQLPLGAVALDTEAVTFVNSIGMREWIRLMRTLAARGKPVVLERVADVMMAQMNVIPELRRTVRIASFHAQYVCDTCGAESTPLIDVAVHGELLRAMRAPAMPCAECGAATQLADFPERYLSIFSVT
jgi:hypothetical protein